MADPISNNEFEKRLKEAAEQYTPMPPLGVWDKISDELHPRRGTYALAIAAVVLLLLASGVYFLQRDDSVLVPPIKEQILENHTRHSVSSNADHPHSGNILSARKSGKPNLYPTQKVISVPVNSGQAAEEFAFQILKPVSPIWAETPLPQRINEMGIPVQPGYTPSGKYLFHQVISQENKNGTRAAKSRIRKRPFLEISFTPGLGYRVLKSGGSGAAINSSGSSSLQFYNSTGNISSGFSELNDRPEWSWAASALVGFRFSHKWSLQTGFSVSELNYKIPAYGTYPIYIRNTNRMSVYTAMRPVAALAVNAQPGAGQKMSFLQNKYSFIEIPVLLNKQFGNPAKVSFEVKAGAGLSYLFQSDPILFSPSSGRYFKDDNYIRPLNGNLHIGASLLIPVTSKWKMDVGPSFQYQILSSYKNYPAVREHPYLIGVQAGLRLDDR